LQLANDLAGGGSPKDVFAMAAVAVPGLVRKDATVWAPNLPRWTKMPLAKLLERDLGIPVLVESDRNAAVLGECWRGAGRGRSHVIVLTIGTGIGAGILSAGRIVRGAHELSGCAGWMALSGEGVTQAAQIGELEALVAGPAIARAAQKSLRAGQKSHLSEINIARITAHDVAAAARVGDRLARRIFEDCGRLLGLAVANLVSLFDPEVVVIGGGMASAADLYLQTLKKEMLRHAQPLAARRVRISVSRLGDKSNLFGCAFLAWEAVDDRDTHASWRS
jgi:glucokinase